MSTESPGAEGLLKTTPVSAGPGATGARGLREAASRSDDRSGPRPCRPEVDDRDCELRDEADPAQAVWP